VFRLCSFPDVDYLVRHLINEGGVFPNRQYGTNVSKALIIYRNKPTDVNLDVSSKSHSTAGAPIFLGGSLPTDHNTLYCSKACTQYIPQLNLKLRSIVLRT